VTPPQHQQQTPNVTIRAHQSVQHICSIESSLSLIDDDDTTILDESILIADSAPDIATMGLRSALDTNPIFSSPDGRSLDHVVAVAVWPYNDSTPVPTSTFL
jgi:hypothetical protein